MKREETQKSISNSPPPRRADLDPISLVTLVGVVLVLMISYSSMRDIDRLDRTLGERLEKLETQMAQAGARPAPAVAPPQQGPDPNRIYTVSVAGAPAKGRAEAPVTIIEFSEFQ